MNELIEEIKEISPNHKVVFVTAGEDFIDEQITRENSGHITYKTEEEIKRETPISYDRELVIVKNPKYAGPALFLAMKKSRWAIVKDFISRKALYILFLLNVKSSKFKETSSE